MSDLSAPAPPADPAVTVTDQAAIVTDGPDAADLGGVPAGGTGASAGPGHIQGDGAPAGEEAALAARERIASERAEHARLVAEIAQARARYQDLQANRPDRSDVEAWEKHRALEGAANEAVLDAGEAADAYLREHPEVLPVYDAALRWLALGICTVPVRDDGTKRPIGEWKEYQERLPTSDELWIWHHRGGTGLGLITGRTDRDDDLDLEMFEFEGRAVDEGVNAEFTGYIAEAGLTECWERIKTGYWDVSPSEGVHFHWLAPGISGNVKLAQRLATPEELAENPKDKYRTLIESRGRGGFSVAAPTPGTFHGSGRPWIGVGSPENIAIITAGEREGIFACARKCHKVPVGAIHERAKRAKHETLPRPARSPDEGSAETTAGDRPGDIFNERGPDWAELLEPHGWRFCKTAADGTDHWTRPGKPDGTSATTGHSQLEGDKFYAWSSSTEFEPGESYSKFAVYSILNHEGDFSAAAAQLRKDGYVPDEEAAEVDGLEVPEPLTDITTPWLPRGREAASTGLDFDGRVPLHGDTKTDDNPHDVLRLAWAVALGYASPHVATLGRDLVVVSGAEAGSLDISLLDPRRLRNLCANGLTYRRHIKKVKVTDAEGNEVEVIEEWEEPALPSVQLCGTALADPAIRLYRPVLAAITRVPVLRPDRTLLECQGVDPSTSMIYWPDLPVGIIPASPDRIEVAAAKTLILDQLLHDFPWASKADKANCLAMLLTSFLEPYAEFLSPLFILDALKSGSGKTFLARLLLETAGAHFRTWVNDEAEIRKALTACLMESDRAIIFDDVGKGDTVSSATLSSALTKRRWDDRVLGVSKNFRGTNNRTWVLTGNNIKLGGDIPSRSVLIHLNPGATDPKDREVSKFALGDLDVWLSQDENKVRVIRALRGTRARPPAPGRSSWSRRSAPTGRSAARSTGR